MRFLDRELKRGFTIIEVIHDIAIVTLVATAVISSFVVSMKAIQYSRTKIVALALANEKMEEMRNLPYDELGTTDDLPRGNIPNSEEVAKQGASFRIETKIQYIDDPFDGEESSGDEFAHDYKMIEVTVYEIGRAARLAHLSSIVASKAAETEAGTGILRIYVNQKDATPVAGADVEITHATSGLSILRITSAAGKPLTVIGVPADPEPNYTVRVSKSGWYATAQKTASVLEQKTTEVWLEINPPGKMDILVVDDKESPMASFPLQLSEISLGYAQPLTTGADGHVLAENLRSGNYYAEETSADYRLIKTQKGDPCVDTTPPIPINDGDNLPVKLIVRKGGGAGGGECTDESNLKALDAQSDWQAGTNDNTDLVSSPGDVKIADSSASVEFLVDRAASDPTKVAATVNPNDKMKAVDRNLDTAWVAALRANPLSARSQNWTIDLGASREITKMRFNARYTAFGGANSIAGTCYVSNDGTSFTTFGASSQPITPGGAAWSDCEGSGNYRYLRFTMGNSGGMPGSVDVSVYELEAYGPSSLATHISANDQIDGTSSLKTWDSFVPNETVAAGTAITYSFRVSDDKENWSTWSDPVDYSGTPISLSSLPVRRYLQVRSALTSDQSGATPILHSYTVGFTVSNCSGGTVCPVAAEWRKMDTKADWQNGTNINTELDNPLPGGGNVEIDLAGGGNLITDGTRTTTGSGNPESTRDGNTETGVRLDPGQELVHDFGIDKYLTKFRLWLGAETRVKTQCWRDGAWNVVMGGLSPYPGREWVETPINQSCSKVMVTTGPLILAIPSIDLMELEVYESGSATHISPPIDGGDSFDSWRQFYPTGQDGVINGAETSVQFSFRTSPDGLAWGEWTAPIALNFGSAFGFGGDPVMGNGRYLQVKSTLITSDPSVTPALDQYEILLYTKGACVSGCVGGYREIVLHADLVSANPSSETAPAAIDGLSNTYWGKFTMADNAWTVERSMTVAKISLTNFSDQAKIYSSSDGVSWTLLASFDSASATTVEKVVSTPTYGQFWKVELGDDLAEGDDGIQRWLGEIKFYEICT